MKRKKEKKKIQFFIPLAKPKDGLRKIENQCPWGKRGGKIHKC